MGELTSRYRVADGPGGVGLLQEFLNTFAGGKTPRPDLLQNRTSALAWARAALGPGAFVAAQLRADKEGLAELRALRDDLRTILARRDGWGGSDGDDALTGRRWAGELQVGLAPDGTTTVDACGSGWARVSAAVLAQVHLAQLDGTWDRLKVCRNATCRVAFYDGSRNRSGAWHDVHVCGNAVNLRASRERRRHEAHADSGPRPKR